MTNWQEVKLGDVCFYASQKIDIKSLSIYNYISTENMLPNKSGITNVFSLPNISITPSFNKDDILVSNIRPYFKKIWLAQFSGGCSNDVLVFRANKNIDSKFLYYILSDDRFFEYSTQTSKGTKMPRGDKTAILKYAVSLPPLDVQKKITGVLGALDDKIELNNKINQNLEAQAQALFKSWFVDFEPFGGKMPSDWKIGKFSDIITDTLGGDWGKETQQNNYTEEVSCIRGADIPDVKLGNKGKIPIRFILPKNYMNKKLIPGDLVIEISGGSPTQSTGRIAFISNHLLNRYNRKIICTNFCRAIKPMFGYSEYIYQYWQYLYDKDIFFTYENGTTGIKNLDLSGVLDTEPIIIPNKSTLTVFSEICNSYFDNIHFNGLEIEYLAELRDTLLPKLMSGEINVDDVKID